MAEQDITSRADDMKRALIAIRDLRRRVDELENGAREPIAIIGMSCRFPGGADTPEKFWDLLRDGVDATQDIPADRWDVESFYDADPEAPGRSYVRRGGFLRGPIDQFDPGFFGISTREADAMDPMQRLLLELSWEALERAGIPARRIEGTDAGVFIGMSGSDYDVLQRANTGDINSYRGTGTIASIAAGRISHLLGVHGPNIALDTACSSALVALALAVDAIRSGRCETALAGTSHLILSPEGTIMLCKLRALSAEGRCRTFDAAASGYARAEGGAMFVLRKLSTALANGDPVLAVIRGAAVNHDGRSSGLTVPNPNAQRAVIEAALRDAGLSPADISYVEAHGTATPLGDPIELRALADALGHRNGAPLMVGSVKTNVGHLEPAAGAAALAKVILSLQHRQIPAHLHVESLTPHVDWSNLGIDVPRDLTDWVAERRVAGISGFGFSGTNAHIIVEEAPQQESDARPRRPAELIVLSGRSREAVVEIAGRYRERIAVAGDTVIADLAATSTTGRSAMPFRARAVGTDANELSAALDEIATGSADSITQVRSSAIGPIAMMFTGQGAQYPGMARELWDTAPAFRAELERCAEIVAPHLDRPLLPLLLDPSHGELIRQTMYTQPALFAVEYAMAMLWQSWGIRPAYVLGHSLGEYVAATVAGVMDIEHALPLVARRGRLMQALPAGGRMAAVFAAEHDVSAVVRRMDGVDIAAINAPNSTVVSGSGDAVQQVIDEFTTMGVQCKDLEVSHAFHSPLMDPILAEFQCAVADVPLAPPAIPLVSNLTGDLLTDRDAQDPERWRRHIREPVRFSASMRRLADMGVRTFLEVGPHPTLCGLGVQTVTEQAAWLPSLRRNVPAWRQLAQTAGDMFRAGHELDWDAWSAGYAGRRGGAAPTYAFQRQRYWFDNAAPAARSTNVPARLAAGRSSGHPLLGAIVESPAVDGWVFQNALEAGHPAWLADHIVRYAVVVPGAAFLEMIIAAAREGPSWIDAHISGVAFRAPLVLDSDPVTCQVLIGTPSDGRASARIVSGRLRGTNMQWTTHVTATIQPRTPARDVDTDLDVLRRAIARQHDVASIYDRLGAHGISYGPTFRGLNQVWTGEAGALARVRLPDEVAGDIGTYSLHPCLTDLSFQLLGCLTPDSDDTSQVFLPAGIDEIQLHGKTGVSGWVHAALREANGADPDVLSADIVLFDDSGTALSQLRGFHARRVRTRHVGTQDVDLAIAWDEVDVPAMAANAVSGTWLMLEDDTGVGARIATLVETRGGRCIRVRRDRTSGADDTIDAAQIADILRSDTTIAGIVHLWSLDSGFPADATSEEVLEQVLDLTAALPEMIAAGALTRARRLRVVTRGAAATGHQPAHGVPVGTALWGLLRVIEVEYPELQCRAVDLENRAHVDDDTLLALLFGESSEDRIAVRDGAPYAPRLRGSDNDITGDRRALPEGDAYRIRIARRGTLDTLHYVAAERRPPGPGEVEVGIRTTGLNFRDVLNVLGMYPGAAGEPGVEFAGLVLRTGDGVANVSPGDEVIGIGSGTFASHAVVPAAAVSPMPRRLDAVEAATIPLAFLTAEWGLHDLAELKAGERVLIHAAAGGVGQAAVQLALACGAEVFATAGSDAKRAHLMAQGVKHVFDSRSASFVDGVLGATNGEGVDVVLNSLTGDLLQRSFELLRAGGRFIEIGKAEMMDADEAARRFPGIRYHAFDLGSILINTPDTFQALFRRVNARFDTGELEPLPIRVYHSEDVVDAFRFMAQARHIGKIVVTRGRQVVPADGVRKDGAYLVTGAGGSVGRAVVEGLAQRGAAAVYLNGRSDPSPELSAWMDGLRTRYGTTLEWLAGDVAVVSDAQRIVRHAASARPPLCGVMHAAGVLDDALLHHQNRERFARVIAPKVAGAWNLHVLTRTFDLDHFVLFSALAAFLGGPGQSSYAAGNAFLDALAETRRRCGMPALSINWGAWAQSAMIASLGEKDRNALVESGLGFLESNRAIAILHRHMAVGRHRAIVADLDWTRLAASTRNAPPVIAHFANQAAANTAGSKRDTTAVHIDRDELAALDSTERRVRIGEYVRTTLTSVLGIRGKTVEDDAEISFLGFDSLMAMELRNRIESDLMLVVPVAQLIGTATPRDLADDLAARVGLEVPVAAGGAPAATPGEPLEAFEF